MRWGFLIFYCVILGIANWLVFTRAERRQFLQPTAAHDMPANWRIEDHDVRLEPSQRLYTKDPVRRGDVIAPAGSVGPALDEPAQVVAARRGCVAGGRRACPGVARPAGPGLKRRAHRRAL